MPILQEGRAFEGYTVATFIKKGIYNESYRLVDDSGKSYFMKLYEPDFMPPVVLDDGKIREVEVYKKLNHDNVAAFVANGSVEIDGERYAYLVTEFFVGVISSEYIEDGAGLYPFSCINIVSGVLSALADMHRHGVFHNDITPRNVIVVQDEEDRKCGQIIDFGHVTYADNPSALILNDLEPLYRSPESFYDKWGARSDIFSAFAVLYALFAGRAPWHVDIPDGADEKTVKQMLHAARKAKLDFPDNVPSWLVPIIAKGLAVKPENRFASADEALKAIQEQRLSDEEAPKKGFEATKQEQAPGEPDLSVKDGEKRVGGGFADVAGMDDLKGMLQQKVIFLLKNRERAKKYRLTPPNGMLLYGPPGCGKTYFAEKFAEETGFNFHFIKASDLGSIYIHGSQGKIAELFDKAEKEAPTIICFDEFDAMVPSRQNSNNQSYSGEVNEFLSQLNNCSKRGIFVIGTTNQPDLIDKAVLRKGRLDISVYIPAPDQTTRRLMFDINLKDRPCADIDTERLAEITEKYVGADIAYIVNDAAMIAALRDEPITMADIENSIRCTQPSLSPDVLEYYEKQRGMLSGEKPRNSRPYVGFSVATE